MNKIDLKFINVKINTTPNTIKVKVSPNLIEIKLNIFNLSNYELVNELSKFENVINIYNSIKRINLFFDKTIDTNKTNYIITKVHNVLYQYYNITNKIKLNKVNKESNNLMLELDKYKSIVMDPNKNPNTYLSYVKSRVPSTHKISVFNIKKTNDFPLSKAVGAGSIYPAHFVHIKPKQIDPEKLNVYLVGKAITFDSGGMNLKDSSMVDMKIDMAGSAIIISVLNLISQTEFKSKLNIHLIIPIVENMIGATATKPGMVVKTTSGKVVEITNTDAEGRLCLADGFEFVQQKLITKKDINRSLIIDVATLTGNTTQITDGITSIISSNEKGMKYTKQMMEIGEEIGEYVEYIHTRREYLDMFKSRVADIKNAPLGIKCGFVLGSTFLNYFINKEIPWIHIDLGKGIFEDEITKSHGINLLFEFLKKID